MGVDLAGRRRLGEEPRLECEDVVAAVVAEEDVVVVVVVVAVLTKVVDEIESAQDVGPPVRLMDVCGAKGGSGGIWGMSSGEEDPPRRLPLALVMSGLGWVGRSGGEY